MRHSIKRVGKRTLSIVLTLMMLVSTMVVGIVSTNAIDIDGVFLVTKGAQDTTDWAGGYDCTSHICEYSSDDNAYVSSYTSTTGTQVEIYIKNRYKDSNQQQKETEYSIETATFDGSVSSKDYNLTSGYSTFLTLKPTIGTTYTFKIAYDFSKITVSTGSSGGGTVTGDLLSVLKGEKVMFYAGEPSGWNQSTIYLYTGSEQSGDSVSKSGVSNGLSGYVLGAFCVAPDINYYVGHSDYAPYSVKPTAGAAYVLSASESSSSVFTKISTNSSGNSLYSLNKGATLTATTTCDSSIQAGSSLNVNTSTAAGKSTIGKNNTIEYYIGDSAGNYSKYSLSNGTLDTSELADGTYTLKTVLSDGNIYVVGDTDTFTVESTQTLPAPGLATTDKGIITSDKPVTLTISNGSVFPDGTTFSLVNASGNTVKALTSGNNTLEFSDIDIPSEEGTYTVVASCNGYNSSSSDEITLKKVQLYEVKLEANADAVVTGTYTDAYGKTGCEINEGKSAKVPSGNIVHVEAKINNTADNVFSKFTYCGNPYVSNPSDITITENGTITTVINDVEKRTVKIAAIEYADKDNHTDKTDGKYLSSNDLTYTFAGSSKTVTMTACAADPTAYFAFSSDDHSDWNGNGHKFYVYEVEVPSTVTSLRLDDKVNISLDSTSEYYAVYNYDGWKSKGFKTSDRYYKVDVVADKSVDSGATVSANGTASVNYASDNTIKLYKNQSNITLTATPSNTSAFSLERWNDGTTDITSPYTVVGEATLTAYFKANQTYTITLVKTDANLGSINSSPASQTYESNTVKVTVKAKTGYECSGLTVKTATDKNVTVTKNDDGTYSFTMPGEDVTVTPTITAKQAANVTVSSNDDTRGTATLTTTGAIYVGDSFTVKAAPTSDNTFKDFTVTGATQVGTVKNADGSTTGTFKATEQNVTVTANFEENSGVLQTDKYLIYQYSQNDANPALLTKSLPIYRLSDGTFIARFSEEEVANMQKNDIHFALSSSKNYSDIYWTNNQNVTVKTDPEDTTLIYADLRTPDGGYKVGHIWLDNTQVIGMEIEVGVDDGKGNVQYPNYVVRPIVEQLPEGTVTVYAKDGTSIEGGTHEMADTRVLEGYDKIISENEADRDCRYRAHKDSYLTIQTTMNATRYSNGYYVYAFCINGLNYPALEIKSGVYQTTYKVAGDEKNSIVEITPVYYNKKIEEAGDYLTIYVDASQLEGRWGNTLSCYSYYYTGEYNDGKPVALETSGYPGQPMLLGTNGLYYTRFPRYSYDETGTKRINPNTNNPYLISGVTVNSFSEKELHGQIYPDLKDKNLQTFDYDDFIYISNLGFDTLKFEIQCRYSVSNQHTLLNGATNAPVKNDPINLRDYESKGWENFYDFDGNKIDIIGNKLSPEQQAKDPIYIVSTGNQNTALGQWSTVWYVYNHKGEYITQGHPSDFISRNADETTSNPETPAYEAIKDQGYEGVPVKICYESNVGADGNTGTRIDGRWYYTKSNQEATVDVSVQYRDDTSSDVWTNDTNETLTAVSGTATIDGVTSKTFEQRNVTAQLNAVPKNGYVFVAWGTVDDEGNYTKLSNIKTAASDFMVDTNYHLVARFEKVEEGSLILTHRKYVGPNAVGGNGYYLLSAVIKDSQDNELASFPITEGEIVIPNIQEYRGCKIEITMTTRMRGINTFVDWYMMSPEGDYDNITQSEDVWGKTGEVSQTIVQSVDNLYNGAELVLNTLHYYSDIARVSRDAVLNYKYYNRFNQEKTYVKHVELDEDDVVDGVYTITDKLIYDNAPAIEDLYKDCVWRITEQTTSKNGTTATIWGTHSESPCNVNLDDGINVTVDKPVKYNNYLKNDNNEFYRAPNANADGTPFAYWLVVTTKDGKEVAKCYANEFNLKIVDHYTITAVYEETRESSLTISEPKYTREQFTDESGNVKSDYLYVDFIVAYMNSNGILLNGELATDYHTGLIVEFDRNIKVDDQNVDDAKLTKPLTEYKYEDYDHTKLQNIATDDTKESGSLTVDGTRALYKFEINNADYNNKNRIDYFVKFDNKNKSFRRYVMKAYYYVYYTDSNGKTVYQQTEPVYFCLFETGNSTAVTSENNNSSVTE